MSDDVLEKILAGRRSQPQQLIEVLQDVQEAFGYIPEDVMTTVARELGVPVIEVSRAANYYKAFSLQPRGRHVITVCMGTACHVRGAPRLLDEVKGELGIEPGQTTDDGMFTLERVNCLGACALGPVLVLDGKYHGKMTPNKLRQLVQSVQAAEKEVPSDR
ncbi:MAG: NADH-quinone oxidoreductase subunit NuoE [Sedimentisphaerales bacterium]|nr:NADH-quinone oxidoreductase subunit NuoE [Sedimentisphaerales bacterium]